MADKQGDDGPAASLQEAEAPPTDGGRKRAAVELIATHGAALRQVAQRYSLCAADADDAYQRTLEIVLTKAPSDRVRELFLWSRTVIKHEALAVRQNRERLLGAAAGADRENDDRDRIALIPATADGPDERLERRELVTRSREALQALKPAELRALTLLAEGYSYAEISQITGFSHTKVNRSLAEGRERFRALVSSSEDGSRCDQMGLLLSAFCDGETSAAQTAAVREHLRACPRCRAVLRAYRATPVTVAALAPALPASRSLLERLHELSVGLHSRLFGAGEAADASVAQVAAAGGTRGAGMAALAKLLAVCAGTAGGAAACVATGVAPAPLDLVQRDVAPPPIERVAKGTTGSLSAPPAEPAPGPETAPDHEVEPAPTAEQPEAAEATPVEVDTGAVEYTEPAPSAPPPAPVPSSEPPRPTSADSGSPAGEFGP